MTKEVRLKLVWNISRGRSVFTRMEIDRERLGTGNVLATRLCAFEGRLKNLSRHASVKGLEPLICGARSFQRDHPTWADRDDLANLFVLESGWAYKFVILPGGRRHISEFFGPGAICNWSRLSDFEEQGNILFKAGARVSMLNAVIAGNPLG